MAARATRVAMAAMAAMAMVSLGIARNHKESLGIHRWSPWNLGITRNP